MTVLATSVFMRAGAKPIEALSRVNPDLRDTTGVVAHAGKPLLDVRGLRVELGSGHDVVSDVSFTVSAGKIIGLVGESGSGKTTVASALLGYVRHGARIVSGQVWVDGTDILALPQADLRKLRGSVVTHVAQDPATALNPLIRIGAHLHEVLSAHEPVLRKRERERRILDLFAEVGLPAEVGFLRRFPHQLSGGQQQRVLLALAFILRPRLIVLDEPTTALDVTTQAMVLDTIRTLCRQHAVAAVYVSHDLAVVRDLADEVIVLYAGRVVETSPLHTLFAEPAHPYTQGLLAALPDVAVRRTLQPIPGHAPAPGTRPAGCAFAPRCPLRTEQCEGASPSLVAIEGGRYAACFRVGEAPAFFAGTIDSVRHTEAVAQPALLEVRQVNAWYGAQHILCDVSLQLAAGECLAIVGESGSGKTTLARGLAGLGEHVVGDLVYQGLALPLKAREREAGIRRQIQYIFQNPYRALNPRHTVGETLTAAVHHFFHVDAQEARRRATAMLAQVSLQPGILDVYPRELSGGERQRVAIARALVCEPRLLICDEITSALDVSVQAAILALLRTLQQEGLAILFVTHDLGVVRALADQVVVLRNGNIIERGSTDEILDAPFTDYTRQLVQNSPSLLSREHRLPKPTARAIRYSY